MNIQELQKELCAHLCRSIKLHERDDGMVMVENPFTFPDGDSFSLYLSPIAEGRYKLSDLANVAMRLSYDDDVNKYFDAQKAQGKRLYQILRENDISEDDGEFYVEATKESLAEGIFKLSQALTQIYDLSNLSKERSSNTFYAELEQAIRAVIDPSFIRENYFFACDKEKQYPTDYYLQNPEDEGRNVCIYGIPNKDKAQLVTIILLYLQKNGERHDSVLVFRNRDIIPTQTMERLIDVGGEQAAVLDELERVGEESSRRIYNGSGAPHPMA